MKWAAEPRPIIEYHKKIIYGDPRTGTQPQLVPPIQTGIDMAN